MIMTYEPIHANDLGHPFQTLQWKHTDVRRDGADCITFLANAVGLLCTCNYSVPVGERSIATAVSVCLSVCLSVRMDRPISGTA